VIDRAAELISTLGLVAHPEGGYYGEVYRSSLAVNPGDSRGSRSAITTIYFLLLADGVSRWHRVGSDEIWHFYEGLPLDLWVMSPEFEEVTHRQLGPLDETRRPVWAVPANHWQAARSTGGYTLVGCTVGPGFDFRDFALADEETRLGSLLRSRHPLLAQLL
jgi:predicted cupin superfamily sugar epimerase